MSRSKGKERKALMFVMAALLSMVLTGIAFLVAVLGATLGSQVCSKLEKSGYFYDQAACMEERIQEMTEEAGLDKSVIKDLFISEEILNNTEEYTFNCIKGYEDELNTDEVRETLRANIYNYLEDEGINKSVIEMDALKVYLGQVAGVYVQTAGHPFVLYFNEFSKPISKICSILIGVLILAAAMCIAFIYALIKMRRKTISYIIRSLIASIIMTGVPAAVAIGTNAYQRIAISPDYISDFAKSYINGIFWSCLGMCLVWVVFIIVGMICTQVIKSEKQK